MVDSSLVVVNVSITSFHFSALYPSIYYFTLVECALELCKLQT